MTAKTGISRSEPARRPLIALCASAAVAATSGTLLYAYPETLAPIRSPFVWVHDISGDVMILTTIWYLWIHLKRTWRLRKLRLSWWTGILIAACFGVAGITGIYGQVAPMPSGSTLSLLHAIASLAVVALACFHGAYGLRRLIR